MSESKQKLTTQRTRFSQFFAIPKGSPSQEVSLLGCLHDFERHVVLAAMLYFSLLDRLYNFHHIFAGGSSEQQELSVLVQYKCSKTLFRTTEKERQRIWVAELFTVTIFEIYRMASTMRTLKKVEAPRPLKSQMMTIKLPQDSTQVTADSLISIAESIASALVTKPTDIGLQNNLIWLSHQLQTHGPRIEINYRDSLNKIFVIFRNASQNEDTNYNIRLTLLQLIELRANNWQNSDGANSYYKTKVSHIQESVPLDAMILSPSPEPFACPMTPTQLLLGPGEIVRTSGKYNRPTKIPGKNYSKDEVVIRNADSGKVMGIKGRRVHMIEELSETIISFQRVNPGAKERLVQITGPSEDKINFAKQLIEDTIRRNASPVRSMEQLSMISLSGGGDCDQDSVDSMGSMTLEESPPRNLRHSRSVNDASIEHFKYTVMVGDETIKLTGTNIHYITLAKLELERYFSSDKFKLQDKSDLNDDVFKECSPSSSLSEEIAIGFGNGFDAPKELAMPDEITTKPLIERRKFFNRKSSEIKEDPVINGFYKYSQETLIDYSQSPYCSVTPKDIANITRNNINKKQGNGSFDIAAYDTQERDCPQTTVISASDLKADSPDPE